MRHRRGQIRSAYLLRPGAGLGDAWQEVVFQLNILDLISIEFANRALGIAGRK